MEKNLTTGSVFKTILTFALPYLLSYFLQTLYGMADLYITGRFCGVDSITAVANGSQVMHMLTVIIVGLAMGSTVIIGHAVGAGNMRDAEAAIGNTVTLFMESVFLISMVPLIELRGAIPVGVAMGLPLWQVYVIAIIGNMLPVPFIFFFARKVLEWGADKPVIGKFFTFCLEKGHKGGAKLKATAGRGLPWALLLFVGIPLPGTGAWTGTLAASLLDMDFKSSVRACMGGVLLAGCIMGALSVLGVSAFGAVAA